MLTADPFQTSYANYHPVAVVGMPGSMIEYNTVTRIVDDPSGDGIGFGLAVSQGTLHGDKSAAIGQASGGSFIGITCNDKTVYSGVAGPVDKFADSYDMPVMDFGSIWVSPATTNVVAGHPVYFNSATGQLGDSSISNAVLIASSKWIDSKPNTDQTWANFNGLARVLLGAMS